MNALKNYLDERKVKKMNPNIKVINNDLWAVNFNYVEMEYIKELTFTKTNADDFMAITGDGKILLNKAYDLERSISIMTAVMSLPDDLLGTKQGFYVYMRKRIPKWEKKDDKWIGLAIEYYNLEFQEDGYKSACEWEKKRRSVKAEYIKSNKKFFDIDKIKTLFKRKGV